MIIDTHFHLDLMENMMELINEFRKIDIGILAVGTTPRAYERERWFCRDAENVRIGLGLHPQLVAEREKEIELFLKLIKESRFIGEVGLDFNSAYIGSKNQQISCFRKIINACSDAGDKVLSIHSVKAAGVVIDELNRAGTFQNNICILHWFTGTAAERRRALESGAWFSINPRMLKTKSGQETIRDLSADKILLETDAPFALNIISAKMLKDELEKLEINISNIRGENVKKQIEKNSMQVFEHCMF